MSYLARLTLRENQYLKGVLFFGGEGDVRILFGQILRYIKDYLKCQYDTEYGL
jgi:hypothetical protein